MSQLSRIINWNWFVSTNQTCYVTYTRYVPLVLMLCIRSYFFIGVSCVPVKLIALALLITISIPPNFSTVSSMDFWICSSFLMSTIHGNACPPAASTGKERRNCKGGNYILGTWIWSIVHGKQVLWNTTFYAYIYKGELIYFFKIKYQT